MTPNEELARRVAAALRRAGVVAADDERTFALRLARGEVRAAEWARLAEEAGPLGTDRPRDA